MKMKTWIQFMVAVIAGVLALEIFIFMRINVGFDPVIAPKCFVDVCDIAEQNYSVLSPWELGPLAGGLVLLCRTFYSEGKKSALRNLLPSIYAHVGFPREYGEVVFVLDDESKADHRWGKKLLTQSEQFKVIYEPLPKDVKNTSSPSSVFPGKMRSPGYDRQQYSNFFCDLYTNATVVGIIDADAMFTTEITPQNIVTQDGRILAVIWPGKHTSLTSVELAIGRKPLGQFMGGNFPIFVHRSTFYEARDYIVKYMKTRDFDEAFGVIAAHNLSYSQFEIIMHYAYYFQPELYEFHFDGDVNSPPVIRTAIHGHISQEQLHRACCFSTLHSHPTCSGYLGTLDIKLLRWRDPHPGRLDSLEVIWNGDMVSGWYGNGLISPDIH